MAGQSAADASAIERGAGTFSKRMLPAGTIQVITCTASRPAHTADERDAAVAEGESLLTMFEPEPRRANQVSITDV